MEPPEVTAAKSAKIQKDRQHEENIADVMQMVCADPIEPEYNHSNPENVSEKDSSLEYNHSTQPYAFKWKTLSDGRKVVEDKFGGFDDELIHVKTEDDSFLWNLAKDTRIKKEQPQEVFAYEPDERLTKWGGTVKERKAEKRKPVKRKKGNSVL